MYPAARLAFCPNTYKPPSSNDEITSIFLSHAMDGWICGEIYPLLPMMQAILLYPMDLNNLLEEKQTIACFYVEYFTKALEHLLWNCLIFLNIDEHLW
jgi:hypothetical protein